MTAAQLPNMTAEEVVAELRRRGVEINVGACGCCDSPWVKIRLDGRQVLDSERACIEMIPDEDGLPSYAPTAITDLATRTSDK